jgi:hypothetical protein
MFPREQKRANVMYDLAVVVFAFGGARPIYKPWHALNMRAMMAKHLTVPHGFIVVTDNEEAHRAAGLETRPLWDAPYIRPTKAHWLFNYVRLGLFSADHGGSIARRILSIDLDAIVRGNIDDMVSHDEPFKILSFKDRQQVQGGLFVVDPGALPIDPWHEFITNTDELVARSRKWVGSDQAVLSELFYRMVYDGIIPHWSEDDGVVLNDISGDWRVFFRTGALKCWRDEAPERAIYYAESGRDPRVAAPPEPRPDPCNGGGSFRPEGYYRKREAPTIV